MAAAFRLSAATQTPMNHVLEQLAVGATAITSTRRLSRYLLEQFAARMLNQGHTAWPTAKTFTWDQWLMREWQKRAQFEPTLGQKIVLEDQQELQLWESIIRKNLDRRAGASLLHISATARVVKDTWRLIYDWQIPLSCLAQTYIEDTQAFFDWADEFGRQIRRNNWVCACQIGSLLQEQVENANWMPRGKLLLVGFDEILPSQRSLLCALREAGCDVEQVDQTAINAQIEVLPCTDRRSEFESAAQWAKDLLALGETGPIGIIVDDLRRYRNDIEVIFDQAMHPAESLTYEERRGPVFHISLGQPLAQYPLIAAAVTLLRFMLGARPINEISRLLHTPFLFGGWAESSPRSILDLQLRQRGWEQLSLSALLNYIQRRRTPVLQLHGCLQRAVRVEVDEKRSPAQWVETFFEWLSLFGWPGERALNSSEYQTVQAWRETLARFARLTVVIPKLGCEQAINRLENLTEQRVFQQQSEPVPVQIMGVLEASGMTFSHLWISGASDDSWPAPPELNPFLPYEIQRRFELPGVIAQRELERAVRIAERLKRSAKCVLVSFPQRRDDQPLHLSPIFQQLPATPQHIRPFDLMTYIQRSRIGLEEIDDIYGPAYDDSPLSGGVSIFKDQAACPFRAFARHRLSAFARPDVETGLTPAERGILVHACIAGFWREIRTSAALEALSDGELERVLLQHIDRAITLLVRRDRSDFYQTILHIERERLLALLGEWLRVERQRETFEVCEIERKVNSSFCGIDLSLRIDRIDQLADGQRVIIDYKTGREISVEDWLGDRPDDPQLPLYLLCVSGEFNALAFAHLRKGESRFKGLSQFSGFVKGVEQCEDWHELQRKWQRVLADIADQFRAGYARVDPKNARACQLCDVTSFCRIFDVAQRKEAGDG